MNQLAVSRRDNPSFSEDPLEGQLKVLREQLDRILRNHVDIRRMRDDHVSPCDLSSAQIRHLLKARSYRAKFFGDDLFADPAWDILLYLYAAYLGGEEVSVSSVCLASGVPHTTGLRWTNVLETRGFISRRNDPGDGRRVYLYLTPRAVGSIEAYFGRFGVPI